MFMSVDLPLPEAPTTARNAPALDREVDAAQRVHGDVAHDVGLLERPRRRMSGIGHGPIVSAARRCGRRGREGVRCEAARRWRAPGRARAARRCPSRPRALRRGRP